MVTLSERMDKETKEEFQGLLIELITRLPAYGIRCLLIPHVIKNDIISKTASDTVEARISVKGNASHIESTTGAKPKDFTYTLANMGDMAAKINVISQDVLYVKAVVLSDSNIFNSNIFDYLAKMWGRLEETQEDSGVISANNNKGIQMSGNYNSENLDTSHQNNIILQELENKEEMDTSYDSDFFELDDDM